jgi:prefoldin subunit 5
MYELKLQDQINVLKQQVAELQAQIDALKGAA